MKRNYVQPFLRPIAIEANEILATSTSNTDTVSLNNTTPADKMESNRRESIWENDGIWK